MDNTHATTADLIAQYRKATQALRGIARRKGRNAATVKASTRHGLSRAEAVGILNDTDRRHVVGLLVEENGLTWRLAGLGKDERPELRERLRTVRRELKAAAAAAPEVVAVLPASEDMTDSDLTCIQCGADVWVDENEVAYHWGGGVTGVDHDLDADHVAQPDWD
jgi:hypothetical protein